MRTTSLNLASLNLKKKWLQLPIAKKLLCVVGTMVLFIAFELFIIFYALGNLLSVRSLIVGEGTWTKAQKDAIHNLYQYANKGDPAYLQNFNSMLKIIEGYHIARVELSQKDVNSEIVSQGLRQGQIKEEEIEGIIKILIQFKNLQYIKDSVNAWSKADSLIAELRTAAVDIQQSYAYGRKDEVQKTLIRVGQLNDQLTQHEKKFSESIIEGSRWLEKILRISLTMIVIIFEGLGIFLIFRLGMYLVKTLNELKKTAIQVGLGNFSVQAPSRYPDELGELGESLNLMIHNLDFATRKHKTSEESLKRSNERFSLMVDAVKDYAIFNLTADGSVLSWNSGAEHIMGYKAEEIIGKHFSIFYTAEDNQDGIPAKELDLAKNYSRYEREVLRVRKSKETFWANVILNARYDDKGRVTSFSIVTRDITERKEYELQLQKSNNELEKRIEFRTKELQWRESQLRQITNALPESVCHVDQQQKILFANESFCQLVGKNQHDILGSTLLDVFEKACYDMLLPNIRNVLQGELAKFDFNFQKDNLEINHNMAFVPDFNDAGKVIGFVLVAHNIKKYKEIEFELKKSKELAEVANETKSAFLANMSHEIRTPLGAILGFSEIILNNEISNSQKKDIVGAIKRNGQLLSNVINDILDLSKVEAGKLEIEKVNIYFDDITKDIESLLNLKATEKGIKLTVTQDEDMPFIVKTDPLRLRQILLNIIGNAIKFTQSGEVHVRIKLVEDLADETSKLAFIVQDTGAGMTQAQSEKIFAPFSQADVSTTRKFGGSGLGLVLSKKLARALGGDVILDKTEINKGSTFIITIDTGLSIKSGAKNLEAHPISRISEKKDEVYHLDHVRVLLVEDSLDNQFIIAHFLKSSGISLRIANNGLEGVNMALSEDFDLVLLDLQMPVMGGFEAIQKLLDKKYSVPIIALTAHAMKEDRTQCLRAGFKDHISKPVNRQQLLKTIRLWTSEKNNERPQALDV